MNDPEASNECIVLARVPGETLEPADFELRGEQLALTDPGGDVTVAASTFGLNAGLRTRLGTGHSTTLGPAIDPGDTPRSDAIGTVTASDRPDIQVGDLVTGLLPWARVSTVDGGGLRVLSPDADPLRHLTILGHVGKTAHTALMTVGRLRAGETVWIPAAAGGVGSCAVQIALRAGAHVIASAGSPAKLDHLRDTLGVADVFDRHEDLAQALERHAPDGLDVYLDLVGGDSLRTGLEMLREHGRAVVAGLAGAAPTRPILQDSAELISRRISMIGMSVTDYPHAQSDLEAFVEHHEERRPFVASATTHHGLAEMPRAFCALFSSEVIGRGVVDLRNEPGPATPGPRS
ncbi:MDR family NADP-dependent oxidoreductase [Janibacter cremeus]|uniref:Enoyl reductase (ER) domain-containing protein n=1 Tax=Janibacter cremeus TaxID=1285192 RepID=A0A852VK74_9MICO|nr:NADP-dependent oxidoreductase [Janibacter cremeus]NYF97462.1 hypothetical protein [Janibacter cremeus]